MRRFIRFLLILFVIPFSIIAQEQTASVNLDWSAVSGSGGYKIDIRDTAGKLLITETVKKPEIVLEIPPGDYEMRVTTLNRFMQPSGSSPWTAFTVLRRNPPLVTSISPKTVIPNETTTLTLRGGEFGEDTTVTLGESGFLKATLISESELRVTLPPLDKTGSYDLSVTNKPALSIKVAEAFTVRYPDPFIKEINPTILDYDTGQRTVTLSGASYYDAIRAYLLKDQNRIEAPLEKLSAKLIRVSIPEDLETGTWDLELANDAISKSRFSEALTIIPAVPIPILNSISPDVIASGVTERIHLYGAGFEPNTQIYIGGREAASTTISSMELEFVVPDNTRPGYHTISAMNREDRRGTLIRQLRVCQPKPIPLQLEPAALEANYQSRTATLFGEAFTTDALVEFVNSFTAIRANVSSVKTNRIELIIPEGLVVGVWELRVQNDALSVSVLNSALTILPFVPYPAVERISPTRLPPNEFSIITIMGAGFTEDSFVELSDRTRLETLYFSQNRIQCVLPARKSGPPIGLTVINRQDRKASIPDVIQVRYDDPALIGVIPSTIEAESGLTRCQIIGAPFSVDATIELIQGDKRLDLSIIEYQPDRLTVELPVGLELGAWALKATNDSYSSAKLENALVILPAPLTPKISDVSPSILAPRETSYVTIFGSGFTASSIVELSDGVRPDLSYISPTKLLIQINAGDSGPPLTLSVENPDGRRAELKEAIQVRYEDPVIKGIDPPVLESGANDRRLIVTGASFSLNTQAFLYRNGQEIRPQILEQTADRLVIELPQNAEPGVWDLKITNDAYSTARLSPAFELIPPKPMKEPIVLSDDSGELVHTLTTAEETAAKTRAVLDPIPPDTSDAPDTAPSAAPNIAPEAQDAAPRVTPPSSQTTLSDELSLGPKAVRDEVFVQGGVFQLWPESGPNEETPSNGLGLSSFWIMKTEVTQKAYEALTGDNPSHFKGETLPVEQVYWRDAVTYANLLSIYDGYSPAYTITDDTIVCDFSATGWRLPTEAEWEYAARGGDADEGYVYAGSDDPDVVAWFAEQGGEEGTKPVATKLPNPLGLYDLSGNVAEWCWDWYDKNPSSRQIELYGPSSGQNLVIRGGCWYSAAENGDLKARAFEHPHAWNSGLGFRLVRTEKTEAMADALVNKKLEAKKRESASVEEKTIAKKDEEAIPFITYNGRDYTPEQLVKLITAQAPDVSDDFYRLANWEVRSYEKDEKTIFDIVNGTLRIANTAGQVSGAYKRNVKFGNFYLSVGVMHVKGMGTVIGWDNVTSLLQINDNNSWQIDQSDEKGIELKFHTVKAGDLNSTPNSFSQIGILATEQYIFLFVDGIFSGAVRDTVSNRLKINPLIPPGHIALANTAWGEPEYGTSLFRDLKIWDLDAYVPQSASPFRLLPQPDKSMVWLSAGLFSQAAITGGADPDALGLILAPEFQFSWSSLGSSWRNAFSWGADTPLRIALGTNGFIPTAIDPSSVFIDASAGLWFRYHADRIYGKSGFGVGVDIKPATMALKPYGRLSVGIGADLTERIRLGLDLNGRFGVNLGTNTSQPFLDLSPSLSVNCRIDRAKPVLDIKDGMKVGVSGKSKLIMATLNSKTAPQGIDVADKETIILSAEGLVGRAPGLTFGSSPDGNSLIQNRSPSSEKYKGIGMTGIVSPIESLIGVFLPDGWPNNDMSKVYSLEQLNIPSKASLITDPKLMQTFFIGSGPTKFTVPEGASRLYLGINDDTDWTDNTGEFVVTLRETADNARTLSDSEIQPGLIGKYHSSGIYGDDLADTPNENNKNHWEYKFSRTDTSLDHSKKEQFWPLGYDHAFAVEWTGVVKVKESGLHTFKVDTNKRCLLYIDGDLVLSSLQAQEAQSSSAIKLTEGYHDITVIFISDGDTNTSNHLGLSWHQSSDWFGLFWPLSPCLYHLKSEERLVVQGGPFMIDGLIPFKVDVIACSPLIDIGQEAVSDLDAVVILTAESANPADVFSNSAVGFAGPSWPDGGGSTSQWVRYRLDFEKDVGLETIDIAFAGAASLSIAILDNNGKALAQKRIRAGGGGVENTSVEIGGKKGSSFYIDISNKASDWFFIDKITPRLSDYISEPFLFHGNGNFYQIVYTSSGLSWEGARAKAENLVHMGTSGHLATITSREENDFLLHDMRTKTDLNAFLLGAYYDRGWRWVTGETWAYTAWAQGEPADSADRRKALEINGETWRGAYIIDEDSLSELWPGFIVEYETSFVNGLLGEYYTLGIPGDGEEDCYSDFRQAYFQYSRLEPSIPRSENFWPFGFNKAFAIQFTGYIGIDEEADYQFYSDSDDELYLYVDNSMVCKSDTTNPGVSNSLRLSQGYHPFLIRFFANGDLNGDNAARISVKWRRGSEAFIDIPSAVLFSVKPEPTRTAEQERLDSAGSLVAPSKTIPFEVLVQGGSFRMGMEDDTGRERPIRSADDRPTHKVTVSSFYMMVTEVKQKDYVARMGNNPSKFKGYEFPVEKVSWHDAVAYANALSQRDKLEPAYTIEGETVSCDFTASGWRLPTEAEWEFAARGGTKSLSYSYSGSNDIDAVAWYDKNARYKSHPVAMKAPNELGLYDMSGNVMEWCWDTYSTYTSHDQTNPTGSTDGFGRICRGGSWFSQALSAKPGIRFIMASSQPADSIGFRLVRND